MMFKRLFLLLMSLTMTMMMGVILNDEQMSREFVVSEPTLTLQSALSSHPGRKPYDMHEVVESYEMRAIDDRPP